MGRPLLWAAAAFACGILAAEYWPLAVRPLLLLTVSGYAVWAAALIFAPPAAHHRPGARVVALVVLVTIFAALGHAAALLDPVHAEAAAAAQWDGRRVRLEGMVAAPPETRDGRQRTQIRVHRLAGAPPPTPFTVLATLPASPALRYGDVIAARGTILLPEEAGNPGEPDLRAALRRRGIAALMRVPPHREVAIVARDRGSLLQRWIFRVRARMVRPLLALPDPYGGVLAGLLLGAQAGGGEAMADLFLRAGLLHLLVVSGAQVGLVAAATLALTGALGRRRGGLGIAAGVILLFAAMVGWSPSVGRAAIMALVGLGARLLRRDPDAASTLALAALLWLAFHPAALFGLGFQLSFAATWGLLFLSPALTPPVRPRWLAHLAATTVGAQIAVLPLLAAAFQRISLAAFPANLLVLPIVAAVVPAGFLLSAIGVILPSLATALVPAFLPPVWAVVALARLFASVPGAQVWLPPLGWWHVAAAYALLALLPRWRRGGVGWTTLFASGLIAILIFSGGGAAAARLREPTLTVAVLDVGQGDAIVVRGPTGRTMLVDGGGEVEVGGRPPREDIGIRTLVPALRRMGVRRVNVVLLSHAHEDHVGGLGAVLENFSVDLVIDPGVPHPSPSYVRFLDLVRRRRIPYALGRQGQRIDLGDGAVAEILWPPEGRQEPDRPTEDLVNSRSIVARLSYGAVSVLLTGDIEAETETALLRSGVRLDSTVLKVAHHGSRTSTTPEFVEAVRPSAAVISVGAGNLFGHPHLRTLWTLRARGVRLYRTDRDGAVFLRTDGRRLVVETMRKRPDDALSPAATGDR